MKPIAVLATLVILATSAVAQEGLTYMRTRGHGGWQGHAGGLGYFQPYYGNYYFPPFVVGSFYARPHPTHLDYFRLRGMPMSVSGCPCNEVPTPPEVVPAE